MQSAIRIALENGLTVYDSLYLSLAEAMKSPLLSLDSRQGDVATKMGINVVKG
jgi:predicted nucleic acid-binding protein